MYDDSGSSNARRSRTVSKGAQGGNPTTIGSANSRKTLYASQRGFGYQEMERLEIKNIRRKQPDHEVSWQIVDEYSARIKITSVREVLLPSSKRVSINTSTGTHEKHLERLGH